jgi:hypothetical protein
LSHIGKSKLKTPPGRYWSIVWLIDKSSISWKTKCSFSIFSEIWEIASCMTSANKRWTVFRRPWSIWTLMKTRIYFLNTISSQFWSHK